MTNRFEGNRLADSFLALQANFDGQIAVADESNVATEPSLTHDTFKAQPPNQQGFYPLSFSGEQLHRDVLCRRILGRVILLQNRQLNALSPAIVTPKDAQSYDITMLNQPFVLEVGFTGGQHFGLSAKAQTNSVAFGGHTSAGAFEAGHFSAVLLGARDETAGQAIVQLGDKGTDAIISGGIPEAMSRTGMMPVSYRTARLPAASRAIVAAFWHPSLETPHGPASGDYPNAVRLMLGAGGLALGQQGQDRAHQLVDQALRGRS